MATGPYDLGPFQTLSAINFAQGGIFGRVGAVNPLGNTAIYFFDGVDCRTAGLVPGLSTPDPALTGSSAITIQIFVGSFWDGHPANPFGTLSEPPMSPANLYSSTIKHEIEGGASFVPLDVGSVACSLNPGTPSAGQTARVETTAGQVYTLGASSVFSPREAFTFHSTQEGNEFELWAILFWYNDLGNYPAVNTARFWAAATVNDRITFTPTE